MQAVAKWREEEVGAFVMEQTIIIIIVRPLVTVARSDKLDNEEHGDGVY